MTKLLKKLRKEVLLETQCPENYTAVDGGCYRVFDEKLEHWFGAVAACLADGARLVTFETWMENEQIRRYLDRNPPAYPHVWIGAFESGENDEYTWIEIGQKLDFYQWYPCNQPDNPGVNDCIHFARWSVPDNTATNRWVWGDFRCDYDWPYICEAEPLSSL